MNELEKTARELILAITEKTLKSLKDKGLLKEPSKLQMLSSSPEMKSLIKKLSAPKYDPNRLLHREVDLYEVCASVVDLETVLLEPRPNEYAQQISMIRYGASPTLREPCTYGSVDRAVVPVLREIHARRAAELEAKRKELGEKEREFRNETTAIEKGLNEEMRKWQDEMWKKIFEQ